MAFGRKKNPQPEAVDPSTPPPVSPAPPTGTPGNPESQSPIQDTTSVAVAILPGVPLPVWAGRMPLTDQLLNVQSYVASGESLPGSPRPAGTSPQWQPEGGVSPTSPRSELSPQWVSEPANLELRGDTTAPDASEATPPQWVQENPIAPTWTPETDIGASGSDSDSLAESGAAQWQESESSETASEWVSEPVSPTAPSWVAEPGGASQEAEVAQAQPVWQAESSPEPPTSTADPLPSAEPASPPWQPVAAAGAGDEPARGWESVEVAEAASAATPAVVAAKSEPEQTMGTAQTPEPSWSAADPEPATTSAPAPDVRDPSRKLPAPASAQRLNQPAAPSPASRADQPIGHIVYGPGTSPQTVASALEQATAQPYVSNDAYRPDLRAASNDASSGSPPGAPHVGSTDDDDEPDWPAGPASPGPSTGGGGGSPRLPNSPGAPGAPGKTAQPAQPTSAPTRPAPPPPPKPQFAPQPPPPTSQTGSEGPSTTQSLGGIAVVTAAAAPAPVVVRQADSGRQEPVIDLRAPVDPRSPASGTDGVPTAPDSMDLDPAVLDLTDQGLQLRDDPSNAVPNLGSDTADSESGGQAHAGLDLLPLTTPLQPEPPQLVEASNSDDGMRKAHVGRWLVGAGVLGCLAAAGTVLFVSPGLLVAADAPAPASQIALPGEVAGMKGVELANNAVVPALTPSSTEPLVAAYAGDGQGATVWLTPSAGPVPTELFAAYQAAGGKATADPQSFSPGSRGGEMQCAAVNSKKSVCFWGTGGITGGAEVTGLNRTGAAQLVAEMRTDLEPR